MNWDPGLGKERRPEKQKLGLVKLRASQGNMKGSKSSLRINGLILGQRCKFLVDSGATGDFISSKFIINHRLQSRCSELVPALEIEMADGTIYKSKKVIKLADIRGRTDEEFNGKRDLVVLPLKGYDAILGMPWLNEVNPDIDWKLGIIKPRLKLLVYNESI